MVEGKRRHAYLEQIKREAIEAATGKGVAISKDKAIKTVLDIDKFQKSASNEIINAVFLASIIKNGMEAINEFVPNASDQNKIKIRWNELNRSKGISIAEGVEKWLEDNG